MYDRPDYVLRCKNCGYKIFNRKAEIFIFILSCPKRSGETESKPVIRTDPNRKSEKILKKY